MNCPHCHVELKISERKNIDIDYCPQCRGVWLDRGELDKLLESSAKRSGVRYENDVEDDGYERGQRQHGRKRKSFLSEIFDF